MNTQKPEPRSKGDGSSLDFHSMFFTLQGEGPYSGQRSIFVRLAGCNLQCPGCDTEYTEGREIVDTQWLLGAVETLSANHGAPQCLVVITGGEPLRQAIGPFVAGLLANGHRVQIESNGVFGPDPVLQGMIEERGWVMLVVSPKTKRIHPTSEALAGAFKYVLASNSVDPMDGLPIMALEHPASTGVARPRPGAPVYINPYDAQDEQLNDMNLKAAANSAMAHGYILGVQLHKLVGLE